MASAIVAIGGGKLPRIVVTATSGSSVHIENQNGKTKTATEKNGVWTFKRCKKGTWTIYATYDGYTAVEVVVINNKGRFAINVDIKYRSVPEFTYTGTYVITDDNGNSISNLETYHGNWQIKFLSSGTFTFTRLHKARDGIDVFIVGGGASGGSGYSDDVDSHEGRGGKGGPGYSKTVLNVIVDNGTTYIVTIGAGGKHPDTYMRQGGNGGSTSAFNQEVSGGTGGHPGNYKKDGDDGAGGSQTYAFWSSSMGSTIYCNRGTNAVNNSGNSSSGTVDGGGLPGSSGIAIIRNAREAA